MFIKAPPQWAKRCFQNPSACQELVFGIINQATLVRWQSSSPKLVHLFLEAACHYPFYMEPLQIITGSMSIQFLDAVAVAIDYTRLL